MPKQIYFIAILPPDPVAKAITTLRKELLPGINLKSEHKKFPHITLQHTFRRLPENENEFQFNLNEFAAGVKRFSVTTANFGHFDKRILYISIINNESLQHLYKQVQKLLLEKMNFTQDEITKSFHPHITLEKKLTTEQFNNGWDAIKNVQYNVAFEVTGFSLLKHNGEKWQPLFNFQLAG